MSEVAEPIPRILLANAAGNHVGEVVVPMDPTQISPVETPPAQPTAEQAQPPEIIPPTEARRKEETAEVFHAAMMKQATGAETKLKDKQPLSSSEKRAVDYKRAWRIAHTSTNRDFAEDDFRANGTHDGYLPDFPIYIGFDHQTAKDIPSMEGIGKKILMIKTRKVVNGNIMFECQLEGNSPRTNLISADVVMSALIMGGTKDIVEGMQAESVALGKIATSRIESISKPDATPPTDLEIQQASASVGVINTEQALQYAKNSGVSEESLTRIQDSLSGKNVLTAEDMSMVLYSTTNVEVQLRSATDDVSRIQKEITTARASLDSLNPETDERLILHYKKEIADKEGGLVVATANKVKFEAIRAEMPASEGDYVTLVQNLYARGHGSELVAAMKSEDPTQALEALLEKSFDPTTEDGKEVQKKFDRAKLIGGAAGFMILLMLLNSMKE